MLGAAAILKAGEAADVVAETGGAVAGAVGRVSWKVARAGGGVATTIGKRTGRIAGRVSFQVAVAIHFKSICFFTARLYFFPAESVVWP